MNTGLDAAERIAAGLEQAWRTGIACEVPPLEGLAMEASMAYAVHQKLGPQLGWWAQGVPRYWKTGAASIHALQTSAPLPDAGIWASPANAAQWPMRQRGVEAEVAFRLGQAVTAAQAQSLQPEQVHALLDAMAVSIELVDFRWQPGNAAPALLKLADLQSHSALVLGDWQPYQRRDWRAQRCVAQWGQQAFDVTGTHPLQDPTALLAPWLRHATQHFGTVPAGAVVTTGSWIGLPFAAAGDAVQVAFDGLGSAQVQL